MTEKHEDSRERARVRGFSLEAAKKAIGWSGIPNWLIGLMALLVILTVVFYAQEGGSPGAPQRQASLVNALTSFRTQYKSASGNALQQNQIKDARNKFLCTFVNGVPQVENWTGRVKSIDKVWFGLMGEYGFSVYIADDIALETYGSALGEQDQRNAATPTNIQEGSKLANAVAGLNKNDRLTFSGEFILDSKGCARERSITTGGSFSTPRQLFRFMTINGVTGNEPPPVSTITDGEKLRSIWLSADRDCTAPLPSWSQARIGKACRDRAAADAQLRAIGWCFGKMKPGDADYWHQC